MSAWNERATLVCSQKFGVYVFHFCDLSLGVWKRLETAHIGCGWLEVTGVTGLRTWRLWRFVGYAVGWRELNGGDDEMA